MLILILLVFAIAAGIIGSKRGRAGLGATLGLFLGPLGILAIVLIPAKAQR
jgi:hypothetical protein